MGSVMKPMASVSTEGHWNHAVLSQFCPSLDTVEGEMAPHLRRELVPTLGKDCLIPYHRHAYHLGSMIELALFSVCRWDSLKGMWAWELTLSSLIFSLQQSCLGKVDMYFMTQHIACQIEAFNKHIWMITIIKKCWLPGHWSPYTTNGPMVAPRMDNQGIWLTNHLFPYYSAS